MAPANVARKVPPSASSQPSGTPDKIKKPKLKLSESFVSARSESPAITLQQDQTAATTTAPAPKPDTGSKCRHCGKSVEKVQLGAHYKACPIAKAERLRKKKEKEAKDREKDGGGGGGGDVTMTEDGAVTATAGTAPSTTTNKAHEDNVEDSITLASPAPKPQLATGGKKSTTETKKNTKKRKAEEAAAAGGGAGADSTTTGKAPPPKKQKKKDAAAAAAAAAAATAAALAAPTPANDGKPSKTIPGATTTNAANTTAGGKPKLPVDVERQCGVPLPNGSLCARSLTCKSHAMGAKRAVPGRSLPYDILLAQYQKKNQAKQQKAAMMASGAAAADDLLVGEDGVRAVVDSDEERDAVMGAIRRAAPKPLVTKFVGGVRGRVLGVRMKEMLAGALAGGRGGGLFAVRPVGVGVAVADGGGGMLGESSAAGGQMQSAVDGRRVSNGGGGGGGGGVGAVRQMSQKVA